MAADSPSRFWSNDLGNLSPYVPGEQPKIDDLVKLNTNENPFGPSPRVIEAIRAAVDDGLRLYPDPTSLALRECLADYHGVTAEQVFVGNGSDEVLGFLFRALFQRDRPVVFPDITYSFYPVYCRLFGIEPRTVALDEELAVDVEAMCAIDPSSVGGVILPNPNAPTGRLLAIDQVERLAAHFADCAVVIDEAYVDFGGESAIGLIDSYPNLLVTQTLSKSRSLAGLRLGFAVGDAGLIEGLARVKDSFNSYPVDRLASAGAIAAYEDEAYFEQTRRAIIAMREQLGSDLAARGFEVLPSAANFVLVRHATRAGATLAAGLRERRVIVRHFDRARIGDHLRITIGNEGQNAALLAALDEILVEG
ncbi:histidinol-phosphate transaminase [Guyparkeria sp. GHLCS8-2]|uniref:histidinol-phosphate transaminase n=1 Tax=Guyparkeria halopsychrophila TaxID=3139421 RepID=UPI0037CABD13